MIWFIIILIYLLIVGIAAAAMYTDMVSGQTVEDYLNKERRLEEDGMYPWYIMALIPAADIVAFFPLSLLLIYNLIKNFKKE
jgi:hypothetical protein